MNHDQETHLIKELLDLKTEKSFYLETDIQRSSPLRYAASDRFQAEQDHILRKFPAVAAHESEVANPGDFITQTIAGRSVLIVRGKDMQVRAFLNMCRHRGTRLEDAAQGCKHAFVCPYHAWTYGSSGDLRGVPHGDVGFPGLDKDAYGLTPVPCAVRFGLVFVVPDAAVSFDFAPFLDPLEADMHWCNMAGLGIAHRDVFTRKANWKLIAEGGLEAYHFKVAHRHTIGPYFMDNLSSYQMLGDKHIRSVLPRTSMAQLLDMPEGQWDLRAHANILYSLFPTTNFLLLQDHISWVEARPTAVGETELILTTLAPKDELDGEKAAHWAENHKITMTTLDEDFTLNELVQQSAESGSVDDYLFGRFESALHVYNRLIEDELPA